MAIHCLGCVPHLGGFRLRGLRSAQLANSSNTHTERNRCGRERPAKMEKKKTQHKEIKSYR